MVLKGLGPKIGPLIWEELRSAVLLRNSGKTSSCGLETREEDMESEKEKNGERVSTLWLPLGTKSKKKK